MAVSPTTTPPVVSKSLYAKSSGGVATFLDSSDISPVQKMLNAQKTTQATKPGSFFESEDWLRMKAFEIRSRIVMYQNLGLTSEYQAAQQEGADVVKKYQALLMKKQADEATQSIEDQINSQLGIDTTA